METVRVFLCDGSYRTVKLRRSASASDLVLSVASKVDLLHPDGFHLFLVDKVASRGTATLQMMSPSRVPKDGSTSGGLISVGILDEDVVVRDVIIRTLEQHSARDPAWAHQINSWAHWDALRDVFDKQFCLLVRRFPLLGCFPLYPDDKTLVALVYWQGVEEVRRNIYHLGDLAILQLSALQLIRAFGPFDASIHSMGFLSSQLTEFLPMDTLPVTPAGAKPSAFAKHLSIAWEHRLLQAFKIMSAKATQASAPWLFINSLYDFIDWTRETPTKVDTVVDEFSLQSVLERFPLPYPPSRGIPSTSGNSTATSSASGSASSSGLSSPALSSSLSSRCSLSGVDGELEDGLMDQDLPGVVVSSPGSNTLFPDSLSQEFINRLSFTIPQLQLPSPMDSTSVSCAEDPVLGSHLRSSSEGPSNLSLLAHRRGSDPEAQAELTPRSILKRRSSVGSNMSPHTPKQSTPLVRHKVRFSNELEVCLFDSDATPVATSPRHKRHMVPDSER